MAMVMKGEANLAYETKVLLVALAQIVCKAENIEEIYASLMQMANSEGVILKPYEDARLELESIRNLGLDEKKQ